MTDISDLADAFKREVAVPGTFATSFPSMQDGDITGSLMDAFAEAQLDGFFSTMALDVDDKVVTPDLSNAGAALVVIYAGIRVLRQQVSSNATKASYKAGPVEYSAEASASVQSEMLKQLKQRRDQLIENARRGAGTTVFQLEGYSSRLASHNYYGGFLPHEAQVQMNWGL